LFLGKCFLTMQISLSMEPSSSCSTEHVSCAYATVEPTQNCIGFVQSLLIWLCASHCLEDIALYTQTSTYITYYCIKFKTYSCLHTDKAPA
jgi:hypothetical protein